MRTTFHKRKAAFYGAMKHRKAVEITDKDIQAAAKSTERKRLKEMFNELDKTI